MFSRREFLGNSAALSGVLALIAPSSLHAAPGRALVVPIDLQGTRVVAPCTISGDGPHLLAIDTGGLVSLIRNEIAKRLHLRPSGYTSLDIAGTAVDRYQLFDATDVAFGNSFRQKHVVFAGVDFIHFGRDVSGSLAAGCLTTYDSELDFKAKEWRVYPDGGPAHDGWSRNDGAIVSDGPSGGSSYLFGRAQLGSQRLRCMLDTGAPTWLSLSGDAARRTALLTEGQNWSPAGKRGSEVARLVRSRESLTFGDLSLRAPLVRLQSTTMNRLTDALIGLSVLQQLDIATGTGRRQLWTRPNGLPPPAEHYNMSGLWIDRHAGQMVAGAVGKGSPAEQAGIAVGDQIDGAEFETLIRRLNGQAGERVAFAVSRGGPRRDVALTLRDYL